MNKVHQCRKELASANCEMPDSEDENVLMLCPCFNAEGHRYSYYAIMYYITAYRHQYHRCPSL